MNISYTYRRSYLIPTGITFILIVSTGLIAIVLFVYTDILSNVVTRDQIFLITIFIGELIVIGYGIYLINKGRTQFEIQFNETNFKSYKNHELKKDIPVEQIESVNIFHGEYSNTLLFIYAIFKKIEIEFKEEEKFQLNIVGKKWISKFLKFVESLRKYCSDKQIQFIESHDDPIHSSS